MLTESQEIALKHLVVHGPSTSTLGTWRTTDALLRKKFVRRRGQWYAATRLGAKAYDALLDRRQKRVARQRVRP